MSNLQKRSVIGIYFSDPKPMGAPFTTLTFVQAYRGIIGYIESQGVKVVIVRGDTYTKKGVFTKYSSWSKKKQKFVTIEKSIHVDLLWVRGSKNTHRKINDIPTCNSKEIDGLCRDKLATYNLFKAFSPRTYIAHSYTEAKEILQKFTSKKIITKPRYGEKSEGVHLIDVDKVEETLYDDWKNILLQEYLDSSGGIPGLFEGTHELKVWLINGEVAGARYKRLHEGHIISSQTRATSGPNTPIDVQKLEPSLHDAIDSIKTALQNNHPSLVRADFVRTEDGYRLIELNSRPSVANSTHDGTDFYWRIGTAIGDALVRSLRSEKDTKLPLIVAAPHAKTTIPAKYRDRVALSEYEVWRMGDPFTGFTSKHYAAFDHIKGDANRILCDLSQGENPTLAFRETDFYGNEVFKEGLEFSEEERVLFLRKYAKAYRSKILKSLKKAHKAGIKQILFVDHHNTASDHPVSRTGTYMPAITVSNGGKRTSGKYDPDTERLLSCPPDYLQTFKEKFEAHTSFTAEINCVYKQSHTIKWLHEEIQPMFPEMKIYCIFLEYDLNLIHNPLSRRNDHLAKALLRNNINRSLDAIIETHF